MPRRLKGIRRKDGHYQAYINVTGHRYDQTFAITTDGASCAPGGDRSRNRRNFVVPFTSPLSAHERQRGLGETGRGAAEHRTVPAVGHHPHVRSRNGLVQVHRERHRIQRIAIAEDDQRLRRDRRQVSSPAGSFISPRRVEQPAQPFDLLIG